MLSLSPKLDKLLVPWKRGTVAEYIKVVTSLISVVEIKNYFERLKNLLNKAAGKGL